MAEAQEGSWFGDAVEGAGSWFGGLIKEGMAGYIEVERAKAANSSSQAAAQDAAYDSPTVDENPTAQAGASVAQTAQVGGVGGLGAMMQNPAMMYVAGGAALLGLALLLKRR